MTTRVVIVKTHGDQSNQSPERQQKRRALKEKMQRK